MGPAPRPTPRDPTLGLGVTVGHHRPVSTDCVLAGRRGHPAPHTVKPSEPWTIIRLVNWTKDYLARKGSDSARLDTEVLLARSLECERIELYTRFEQPVADDVLDRFRDLVRRRAEGAPVAYLVGYKEFFSLVFRVTPAVMIPRPETELVVTEALREAENYDPLTVVDVGTGSGSIAVAFAANCERARVVAIDVCADALAVARGNAQRNEEAHRIDFRHGDLLEPILSSDLAGQVHLVLSNPPYIPTGDIAGLPVGVRDFEPHGALDGGADGLDTVRRLTRQAPDALAPGGQLILEIGSDQEQPVRALIEQSQAFDLAPTVHDHAGHPRVVRAARRGIEGLKD